MDYQENFFLPWKPCIRTFAAQWMSTTPSRIGLVSIQLSLQLAGLGSLLSEVRKCKWIKARLELAHWVRSSKYRCGHGASSICNTLGIWQSQPLRAKVDMLHPIAYVIASTADRPLAFALFTRSCQFMDLTSCRREVSGCYVLALLKFVAKSLQCLMLLLPHFKRGPPVLLGACHTLRRSCLAKC